MSPEAQYVRRQMAGGYALFPYRTVGELRAAMAAACSGVWYVQVPPPAKGGGTVH